MGMDLDGTQGKERGIEREYGWRKLWNFPLEEKAVKMLLFDVRGSR